MKKYIGIDPGAKGFVSIQQYQHMIQILERIDNESKDIKSFLVDKILSNADLVLDKYCKLTAKEMSQSGDMLNSGVEVWRDITLCDKEHVYQVSNLGRVRNLNKNIKDGGRILKIKENPKVGYMYLTVKSNGKAKHFRVHRLVAEAFIPNPNNYKFINHKDENKLNNKVDNLEWCDGFYNINYGTTRERILQTRKERNCENKGVEIVGINPETNAVCARFISLRQAHAAGYKRATIARRIRSNNKTTYKGLIWQKVG